MRLALITTIFLLLIPSALAIDVVDLQFYSHGEPLTLVSYNIMPNIDVEISVSGENFSRLIADISGIHKNQVYAQMNGYDMKTASVSTCLDMNGTFVCHLKPRYGIQMRLANSSVIIPIKLYDKDDYLTEVEQTISFSIDNEPPTVIDMRSEKCIEETCYVASGKLNNLVIQFDDGPFNKGLVRFQLGDKTRLVDECSGSTCTGKAAPTCVSGQVVSFKILRHQTFDDAYNKVTNSFSRDLTCDSVAPEVLGHDVDGATAEYVKIGDTMIVTVNVSEDIGPVSGVANFSSFGAANLVTGTCSKKGSIYECIFSTPVSGEGPFFGDALLKISDFAGNTVEYSFLQEVFGLSDEQEPNYWSMTYNYMPTILNKQTMPYTDKKIYTHIKLTPTTPNVKILGVTVSDCQPMNGTANTYLGTNKPEIFNYGVGNVDPVVKFTLSRQKVTEEVVNVKFNCSILIQTRKTTAIGKYYIQEQEHETLEISYAFTNLQSPDELIKQEVLDLEQDIADFKEWFDPIYTTIVSIKEICDGWNLLNTGAGVLHAVGVPLSSTAQTKDTGETLNDIAKFLGLSSEGSAGKKSTGASLCEFLTCESEYNGILTGQLDKIKGFGPNDNGEGGYLDFMGYESYSQVTDPYDSLFTAIAQLCLPAVMYNYQKLQAIDCEYLRCLAEDVALGTALVSDCEAQRSYMNCKYWVGGVFDVFPITALLDDTIDMLKDSVDDPVSLFGTTLSIACKIWGEKGTFMRGTCDLAADVSKVANFLSEFMSLVNQPAKFAEPKSQCDTVLANIDQNRGYYKTIPNADKPKDLWDSNTQCGISGCFVLHEGEKYLVVPNNNPNNYYHGDPKVGEPDFFIYKKVGDSLRIVDGAERDALVKDTDVLNQGSNKYKKWLDDYVSTVPDGVASAFDDFIDARDTYLFWQKKYEIASNDYFSYRNAYDVYSSAQNRLNRRIDNKASEERIQAARDDVAAAEKTLQGLQATPHIDYSAELSEREMQYDIAKSNKKTSEQDSNEKQRITNDQWSGVSGMGTMFNTMRGFNSMSNFLQDAGVMKGWGEDIDRAFQNVILDSEYRTSKICESNLKKSDSNIAIKESGALNTDTAARITGERTALIIDEEDLGEYTYAVVFMVNPKKTGLNYEVVLKGNGGSKTIFTNQTTDERPLHTYFKDDMLTYESEKLYTQACLKFNFNGNSWKDYFDVINSPSNNEFCDTIREVEQ